MSPLDLRTENGSDVEILESALERAREGQTRGACVIVREVLPDGVSVSWWTSLGTRDFHTFAGMLIHAILEMFHHDG